MGRLFREWRRLRDQAGELLYLVAKADTMDRGGEAEKVYEEWRTGRMSYEEARKRLEKLLEEARATARA